MDTTKMDFVFVIPDKKEDLFNSNGKAYRVNKAYDAKEIQGPLHVAGKAFVTSDDPFYMFDYFDVFFSVIESAETVSRIILFKSMDLLSLTNKKMERNVADFLAHKELDVDRRKAFLNLLKMTLYLCNETIKAVDGLAEQASSADFLKKKGKKQTVEDEFHNWGSVRTRSLIQLYNVIQHPLERLWDPPLAEEDFVNLVCDVCYRTLESPYIKEKGVNETCFQILGTCIKRYNHAMTFPVKIMAILGVSEISITPIASGIALLYQEFGIISIVRILMKELVETMSVDSADAQSSKFFSQFLADLGATDPKIVLPYLQELGDELLNLDSHIVRNTVLQMMGDVVICELTSTELSPENREIREDLLERIVDHMMDVSAHVRSKVLQIWNHMKEENAVPLAWQRRVLTVTIERLEDKTSLVRKNAVILIKSFLERNPFSAKLAIKEAEKRYEEEVTKLQELRTKMVESAEKVEDIDKEWEESAAELMPIIREQLEKGCSQDGIFTGEDSQLVHRICQFMEKKEYHDAIALMIEADLLAHKDNEIQSMDKEKQCVYYLTLLRSYLVLNTKPVNHEEFNVQLATVNFLRDSIEFSKLIIDAVPKIQMLLRSKTNSDVFEAIDFFTTGFLFGIKETEVGMREILFLVWSVDKEKRDAVTRAYKKILFTTDKDKRAHAIAVVTNLCNFFEGLTVGQYAALEVLVKEWVEEGDIDIQIIQVMFERFTKKLEDTSDNVSRQALELLIMTSAANPKIATSNIDLVASIGFDTIGIKDPRIFAQCLRFLLAMEPQSNTAKYYKRFDRTNPIVQKIEDGFKGFYENVQLTGFESIAKATFDFIYHLTQAPDITCQDMIKHMCKRAGELAKSNVVEGDGEPSTSVSTVLLSRILFTVGYAAVKEMIFLDIDIYNNMKHRQQLKDEKSLKKKNRKSNNMNTTKRKTLSLDLSASDALKRRSGTNADAPEQEDIVMYGSAEDNIAELCNHICEEELMYAEDSLLKRFVPIMEDILKHPGIYSDKRLQQSACLSFTRLMTLSSKFCEEKMPFLMNILNQTDNIIMKTNIVIGMSDLTFRFPNVIEPWTGYLYLTLHEPNDELRLAAVKMLAHLILHEMIRVKGQISDLAVCIVDPNEQIRNITQQFFSEIATKLNILYNVLPDIISRLSDPKLNLEEPKYQCIMKHIIGLIQKDRQIESLVEKLCLRFRVTFVERQWRDIAYCLSQLNYTERSIKKLMEHIQNFKDKLHVDEVMAAFKTIINNTSKLAKAEFKTLLTEFEQKLDECLQVKDDDEEGQNDSESQKAAEEQQRAKPKKPANRRGKKKPTTYSDSEDDEPRQRRGGRGKAGQKTIVESDSSDESPEKSIRTKRGRKR